MLKIDITLFTQLLSVIKTIPRRLSRGHYFREASALSFSTVLALVPLLAVVFSALSLFPIFEIWSSAIQAFVYENFVPQLGEQIRSYIEEFSANTGQLTIWGLVFLLITALTLLATIEDAFNDIWKVKKGRSLGHRILVYWTMLTLGPILIALSLSLSSYMWSLTTFSEREVVNSVKGTLLAYLPFVLEVVAFVLFYFSVPNCTVRFRNALIGGTVAALLFELAKYGFGQYLSQVKSYQLIYGALAILPVFLIWIYLSWLVVLIGAYITAAFGDMEPVNGVDSSTELPPELD
jgi:membrane protein